MEKLRIGIVAPPWFAVPPVGYGGTEMVVSNLADGLVARGHDVTLFASGGSRTTANLVTTFETPPSTLLGDAAIEGAHILEAYAGWRQFDIIHDHTMLGLLAASAASVPVVHTVHGAMLPRFTAFYTRLPRRISIVAISNHQRSTLPPGVEASVIYNGIDVSNIAFSPVPGDYLLFVGRASHEKGPLEAIQIAKLAGMPLLMLCKVNEIYEHDYYERVLKPALRGADVDLRLETSVEEKARAFSGAFATLFPINWPEPFGLVMTESMAAGTPVIAFQNGSAPEVVEHGRTGFVVQTVEEAARAVQLIPRISRDACRERVETQFSARLNVIRHEQLYRRILGLEDDTALGVAARRMETEGEPGEEATAAS